MQGAGVVIALAMLKVVASLASGQGLNIDPAIGAALFGLLLLSGGTGGAVYYLTDPWRARRGLWKTMANVLSLLAYALVALGLLLALMAMPGQA